MPVRRMLDVPVGAVAPHAAADARHTIYHTWQYTRGGCWIVPIGAVAPHATDAVSSGIDDEVRLEAGDLALYHHIWYMSR